MLRRKEGRRLDQNFCEGKTVFKESWISVSLLLLCLVAVPWNCSFAAPPVPKDVFELDEVTNSDIAAVLKRIAPAQTFRAQFNQEKQVQGMLRPVQSSGNFLFSQEHGIVWQILSPFASRLIITPKGVKREVEGQPSQFFKAAEDPAARGVSQIFLGLFGNGSKSPAEVFQIYFREGGESWVVGLVPKNSQLRVFLHGIVLVGDKKIEKIWILEGLDETFIEFLPANIDRQEPGQRELTQEEREYFSIS
jgi:hypothetical protein